MAVPGPEDGMNAQAHDFTYRGRMLVCAVCGDLIWPRMEEENAPANADVKAHRKCVRVR